MSSAEFHVGADSKSRRRVTANSTSEGRGPRPTAEAA
jgi:hypothetical protein